MPDKDADGLDAGVIVYKTLVRLGLSPSHIDVHFLGKHHTVHDAHEREAMSAKEPSYVIVLDQGSRRSPPIVTSPEVKTLVIDHHLSDEFPENAEVSYLPFLIDWYPNSPNRLSLHVITLRSLQRHCLCTRSAKPFIQKPRQHVDIYARWAHMEILEIPSNGKRHSQT